MPGAHRRLRALSCAAADTQLPCLQRSRWLPHQSNGNSHWTATVNVAMHCAQVMDEEMVKLRQERGDARYYGGHFEEARGLFVRFSTSPELADFLTLAAYEYIVVVPMAQRSRL